MRRVNDIQVKPPPIQVTLSQMLKIPKNNLFESDFPNIFIIGKKESGKTNLILNILDNVVDDNTIIICFCNTIDVSDMWRFITDKYSDQMVKYPSIEEEDKKTKKTINNLQAFIDRMGKEKRNKENNTYVVIFDDISGELRNKYIKVLYKQNRHFKCMTITSSQGAKDIVPDAISQLDYCILLGGIPGESVNHIHKNLKVMIPEHKFAKLYEEAIRDPYNFLMVDCKKEVFRKNFDLEFDQSSDED